MQISILVPVIVSCDGKGQESIEAETGELAYQKVLDNPRKYISYDNVDWANCKVDDFQPEPKNPGEYRFLEHGEEILPTDEARESFTMPIPKNEQWEVVGNSVTWSEDDQNNGYVSDEAANGKWFRRKISANTEPKYRPFKEGEVIEEGDQYCDEYGQWKDSPLAKYGNVSVEIEVADNPLYRKLIK
jgi:hypothetical protein